MRELQPHLPRKVTKGVMPAASMFKDLLTLYVTGQTQEAGMSEGGTDDTVMLPAPNIAVTGFDTSSSSSHKTGAKQASSIWVEPSYDDTRVSNCVFAVGRPGLRPGLGLQQQWASGNVVLQQGGSSSGGYHLLVPHAVADTAQKLAVAVPSLVQPASTPAAAAAVAAISSGSSTYEDEPQQEVQQQQRRPPRRSGDASAGGDAGAHSSSLLWKADVSTESLLDLLPTR